MLFHLSIHHFYKNQHPVFSRLDWKINTNEHWAIIGDIGTGKTMLLKIIAGIEYLALQDGRLAFTDTLTTRQVEFVSFSDEKKWIKRADFYYQQRYYTSFTEDEISLQDFIQLNILDNFQKEKTAALLQKYQLNNLLHVPFIQLSNGQKNKSILIKALLSESKLLLLDNPFIGIDAQSRKDIFDLIDTLVRQDKQVIYTTNYPDFATSTTHILSLEKNKQYSIRKKEDFHFKRFHSPKTEKKKTAALSSENIIELNDVVISYHDKIILDHITWKVIKGEKWAVTGENGSGKSTLLSLLYADHPQAYKNNILLFNEPRKQQSIWEIKERTGYLSSEFHLHFNEPLTVAETVGTGFFDTLALWRSLTEEQCERIDHMLEALEITSLKDRYFLSLSFGEQRLVLFARALIKQPELLILDEPYQGLDDTTIQRCNQLLDNFLSDDHTLIFTTHYAEEIPDCINKFLHLAKGKIISHE